jgi:hypothetical protein
MGPVKVLGKKGLLKIRKTRFEGRHNHHDHQKGWLSSPFNFVNPTPSVINTFPVRPFPCTQKKTSYLHIWNFKVRSGPYT